MHWRNETDIKNVRGKPEGDHLGESGTDERVIIKYILKKLYFGLWAGLWWLRTGTSGGIW